MNKNFAILVVPMPKSIIEDKPLCFIDVETTGTNALNGRIIEIGILKVINGELVREYESLINPELRIDPFIESMTGINYEALENAPVFSTVKDEIYEMLADSIFVAHNVRFDYSFVRNEFKRQGVNFSSKHFDTIKLARFLYPGYARYNLDSIMERHGITNNARHRAFGDAKVLWDFFKLAKKNSPEKVFREALNFVLKKPSLPLNISAEKIDSLPESPGVYIFYGENGMPVYIGKSIDIKDRVLSHFSNDLHNSTDMKIAQTVKDIEVIVTAGELSALLLESTLIKKMKPVYNRMLRESRKMTVLVKKITGTGHYSIDIKTIDEVETEQISDILGTFRSIKQAKDFLFEVSKEFKLCHKILGLEKGKGYCFNYQLGLCNGICKDEELTIKYNIRFDEAFHKRKVKKWNFESPILIREDGEKSQLHLIDKWCYLGSIKDESQGLEDLKKDYIFDYDTYRILNRYLTNPNNLKTVTKLNNNQVFEKTV